LRSIHVCSLFFFQSNWTEVPAAGLYCIKYDCISTSSDAPETVLFPWIQSDSHLTSRVVTLSPETKFFNSDRISSIDKEWRNLIVGELGLACNVPAVSLEPVVTENVSSNIVSVEEHSEADNCVDIFKYATKDHVDTSNQFLTVLSESVRVRVSCQDLRCDCCLLETRRRKCTGASFTNTNDVINEQHQHHVSDVSGEDGGVFKVLTLLSDGSGVQQTTAVQRCDTFVETNSFAGANFDMVLSLLFFNYTEMK
jgi:hypothetical protein